MTGGHVSTGTGHLVGLFVGFDFGHLVGLKTGHLVGFGVFVGLGVLQTGMLVGQGVGGPHLRTGSSFVSTRFSLSGEMSTALRTLNRSRERSTWMIGDILILQWIL